MVKWPASFDTIEEIKPRQKTEENSPVTRLIFEPKPSEE